MSETKSPESTPVVVETPAPAPVPVPATALRSALATLVDLVAIAGTLYLANSGKVGGEAALCLVALLAGVRLSDLVGAKNAAKTGGLAALVLSVLHSYGGHAAIATASVGSVVVSK